MNTKTTYVLGALAIIGGLFLLIAQPWQKKPADEASVEDTAQRVVIKDAPAASDVDRLEIVRPGEPKLAFARNDGGTGWRIVEPIEAPAVDFRVQSAITALTGVEQIRRYAAGDKNRPSDAEAGVGDEAVVATLHDAKANKSLTFRIGTNPPLSGDTYVMLTGSDELLIVKGAIRDTAATPLEDFRNKRLMAQVGRDEIASVRVEGADQYELTAGDDKGWMIESPVRARADKAKVDALVNSVRNLTAERFVEDAPKDLARFALDAPSIKVTLVTETQAGDTETTQPAEKTRREHALLVGGRAGEAYFAKLGDRPWVFTIPARTRDELAKPLDELRDRQLLPFTKENVTGITIEAGGQTAAISRDEADWVLDDGAAADLTAVDDLLKSARDLKAVTFVASETLSDPGLDPPQAAVSIAVSGEEAPLRLEIGNASASGEMVYVRNPATGTTAIVRLSDVANLNRPPAAYRSRDMLTFGKGLANWLEISRDDKRWVLEKAADDTTWRISEPLEDEADAQAVDAILSDLYNLRARAVAGVENPADFGLDSPEVTVSVRYQPLPQPVLAESPTTQPADGDDAAASQPASGPTWVEQEPVTHVVRVAEHDGAVYATVDDGELVFEIDRQILQNLLAELLNRRVAGFEPSQVVGIRFVGSQGVTELNRVGDAWQYADDPLLPIATKKVVDAITALSELRTEHYYDVDAAALAAHGLDAPVLSVAVTLDDHRTIELGVSDDGPDDVRGKYARSSATGRVFVLEPDQLGAFNKSIEDFKVEPKP